MLRLKSLTGGKKGFLLLEVLVSVVVITVGLTFIIRSFSISTRAIATSRHYMKALSLLEEKLWELEERKAVESGEDEDYFERDSRFSWEVNAETEEELPINKMNLKISWRDRQRKQTVSVTSFLWNREE